jgi:putative tricarboxylic transport membrane protein
MFFFGLIGYACEKMHYPTAPVVLGLILGPLVDSNLRRMLKATGGSLEPFVTRPISLIILLLIISTIAGQFGVAKKVKNVVFRRKAKA